MIRPVAFRMNEQTAVNNYYQKILDDLTPESVNFKAVQEFDAFVEKCFDSQGNKQADTNYFAVAGKGAANCKYCPFKTDYENCPKDARIRE